VAIRGQFSLLGNLELRDKRSGAITGMYTPLQDSSGDNQLLVSTIARMNGDGVVTGTLRAASPLLRDYLRANPKANNHGRVNQELILVANQTPAALATGIVLSVLSSIVLALVGLAWRSGCVVFKREQEDPDCRQMSTGQTCDLRVSGTFNLAGMSSRLTEAPAQAQLMADGSLGFVSNVVVSRARYYGVMTKTTSFAGDGVCIAPVSSVATLTVGRIYFGHTPRPAIALGPGGAFSSRRVILSFASTAERDAVVRQLRRHASVRRAA
jgi:hypothetical protein